MQTNIDLRSAFDVIKDTYDFETCKDIVKGGCVSGVATDHIYYKDTVAFFDKYEDEVTKYITDTLGEDTVKDLWNKHPNNITGYKNDMTWTFIELVAMSVVDSDEIYAIQA